jgi:hypothetical protein
MVLQQQLEAPLRMALALESSPSRSIRSTTLQPIGPARVLEQERRRRQTFTSKFLD